ncbi:MAG: HNH endonuclease [Bacteroidales bacterium]|nr:HNH endonuclease [Bacteroidales bacterium]
MKAIITYNPVSQKRGDDYYDKLLTDEVLLDICQKVTKQSEYSVVRSNSGGYNKGRLLTIDYSGHLYYVTLSETANVGRNSNVQSVPTAINQFYADPNELKTMCYYFLPHTGNLMSDYYMLYYRMLKTIGVVFLNSSVQIKPYSDIIELIGDRQKNSKSNKSNNSSYITMSGNRTIVYGKVYGANKYESTLFGIVAATVTKGPVDFYNVCEKDLKSLPKASLTTFSCFKNIKVHDTSLYFDKKQYVDNRDDTKLRSHSYIYNLYERIGEKKCALCDCNIPEIIQGAHIWGVAEIASSTKLSREQKFDLVNSSHNGMWLCQNHHKLFDCHILMLGEDGKVLVKANLDDKRRSYIKHITPVNTVVESVLSPKLLECLHQRNRLVDLETGISLSEL